MPFLLKLRLIGPPSLEKSRDKSLKTKKKEEQKRAFTPFDRIAVELGSDDS